MTASLVVAVIDPQQRPRETMLKLARSGVRGFRITPGAQPPDRWLDDEGMAAMWKCGVNSGLAICPLIGPRGILKKSSFLFFQYRQIEPTLAIARSIKKSLVNPGKLN